MNRGWDCVQETGVFLTFHIVPLDDLIEHEVDCICGPRTEVVERADGAIGWLIHHYSLDNREAGENDAGK